MAAIDPSVLVAPDYQTQMMQAQHRLALAQQLQQMSMTDTPGNGGTVSWTQGLARLADALVGGMAAKKGYKEMQGANQAYAAGLRGMFGQPPQAPQAPPQGAQPVPLPPQGAPPMPQGGSPAPQGAADPLAPLPNAPPQAASPPPAAASMPPQGGAPSAPWSLTGNPQRDMALYMSNPEEFGKAMIGANAPTDFAKTMAQAGIDPNSPLGHQIMQAQVAKQNFIAPTSFRPGGWSQDASGQLTYHPQAPAPGAMPVMGPNGPTGAWTDDPSAANIQAQQAGAIAGAQAGAKAPYQFQSTFENGQPGVRSVASLVGAPGAGGSLNQHYGVGQPGGQSAPPANGFIPTGAPLGVAEAAATYGKGQAQGALDTQAAATTAPQVIQSYREMESLLNQGLKTSPARDRMQKLGEEHGLNFLTQENAFVFNKDAARAVAQDAQAVGLNGSDTRLGMLASANPSMKMPPEALQHVLPVMIGLKMATIAKSMANTNWVAQNGPQSNAQFNNWWLQNYDPRMFTAIAMGPKFVQQRMQNPSWSQAYTQKYNAFKALGVNFGQFAQ